ncbi:MAG TPA: InlB B-repeat-containing protein, partial [Feifaniaceae bacterium]|nr:InlB B-repeat-containing protein [Feifaniaceae bacterium]
VTVSREGQDGEVACYEGMKLQDQDVVTAAGDGSVILKLDDDKYVYLEPNTQIKISAAGKTGSTETKIELISGAMSAVIEQKLAQNESFSVTVDNVSMVVRGTIFRIARGQTESGAPTVTVQTVEGTVGVTAGDSGEQALESSLQDVILLTDTGGTFTATDTPIDYSALPPETQDWIYQALEDKLDAATDPEEIETLQEILDILGAPSSETAEMPLPAQTEQPAATPTEPPVYTLSILQPKHGKIQASGGDYQAGDTISLLAVPDDGYQFSYWMFNGGAGSAALGKSVSATLTMPESDATVSAKFSLIRYTLTIQQPAVGGSIAGTAGKYAPGSGVSLTAAPSAGYVLACWLVNGSESSALGTASSVTYRMTEHDATISAEFAEAYTLTIEQPVQGGSVSGTGGLYPIGAEVALSAAPANGYAFTGWIVNGSLSAVLGTNASITYVMPSADTVLGAVFTQTTHTLSFEQPAQGGGSINMTAGQYASGDTVSISAAPDTNMQLAGLLINGVFDGSYQGQTSMEFTMPDEDVVISAIFQSV